MENREVDTLLANTEFVHSVMEIEHYAGALLDYIQQHSVVRWQWPSQTIMNLHNQMNHIFYQTRKT